MPFRTLIDSETLERHLGDPSLAVVDCRFRLDDVAWGERAYESQHIPGAVYADLDRDLAGTKTGMNGRHPLPEPSSFADTLGRLGIDGRVQVVAYDQDAGMYASRLWWMIRWLGHDNVAVLDGGLAKWLAEGRRTTSGREHRDRRQFHASVRGGMVADVRQVDALARNPAYLLLDARAPERFAGQQETIDKKAGHIPGAANHFFKSNLCDNNTVRAVDVLRTQFERSLGGVSPDHVICYCGSGVTACENLLAMEHAGLKGAKLYPGSWSEWSSDPSRPTEPPSR
jgi:thiosulfate/3-mercaptopyruvate sulfurtransferase